MKILITGATGTVGGALVAELSAADHELRVLVRDAAKYDGPGDVEVVTGDLTDAADVRRALEGVDRAFLNMADDNGAVFASVVADAGVDHVVLLSSFTAVTELALGDANIITLRHRAGEAALLEAGIPATFLRASGFDYNVLMWASEIENGVVGAPYLDVALPVVDPADIAAAAASVLTASNPEGGAYSITGPEALTVRDQTRLLSEVLGRPIDAVTVPVAAAKAAAFPAGTPDSVVDSVFGTFDEKASVLPVSTDVSTLTGRPARTFEQWAIEHAAAFQ